MPRRPRIYVTGDTHGYNDIDKLTSHRWPEGRKLTKDDILIIAGDFGLVFYPYGGDSEKYWLDWLDECPWTTLFIDGNHENFDRLYNEYPCEERYGGPVGVIRPSVLLVQAFLRFGVSIAKFYLVISPLHKGIVKCIRQRVESIDVLLCANLIFAMFLPTRQTVKPLILAISLLFSSAIFTNSHFLPTLRAHLNDVARHT